MKSDTHDLDTIVYDGFCAARQKNIPITSPILQEKALEVVETMGLDDFKASNGWLEKLKNRYNITCKVICCE